MLQIQSKLLLYSHWSYSSPPLPRGNHHLEGDVHLFLETLYILENPLLFTKGLNIFLRRSKKKDSNNKLTVNSCSQVSLIGICKHLSKINSHYSNSRACKVPVRSSSQSVPAFWLRLLIKNKEESTHQTWLRWAYDWIYYILYYNLFWLQENLFFKGS